MSKKHKKHKKNTKKGIILSLDVIIGMVIIASLIVVSAFYLAKAGDESVSRLQATRIGYDILAILDYDGTLDTLSSGTIETELNKILPINYHTRIKITCANSNPVIVETTDVFPQNRFIAAGKRSFVTYNSRYCIAGFEIWLR